MTSNFTTKKILGWSNRLDHLLFDAVDLRLQRSQIARLIALRNTLG
jgi:hypothetical protein